MSNIYCVIVGNGSGMIKGVGVQMAHVLGQFFNEKDSVISLWDSKNVPFLFSLVYSHATSSSKSKRILDFYPFLHLLGDKSLPDFTFSLSIQPKKYILWVNHFLSNPLFILLYLSWNWSSTGHLTEAYAKSFMWDNHILQEAQDSQRKSNPHWIY